MDIRRNYDPARDLKTEVLRVAVPLQTKLEVEAAAQRVGRPVSELVRDAIGDVISGSTCRGRGGRS